MINKIILLLLIIYFIFPSFIYAHCSPGATNVCSDGTVQSCTPSGFQPPCGSGINIGAAFRLGEKNTDKSINTATHLNSVGNLISTILPNVFVIAGVIIFFFIILGGFTMITSAGNPEKQKEGSAMITGAVMGFVIIFGAYWIVQLLEWILGVSILNPGGI